MLSPSLLSGGAPLGLGACRRVAARDAFHGCAVYFTLEAPARGDVVRVAQGETDRVAVQPRIGHRRLPAAAPDDHVDLLILLHDVQLVFLATPLGGRTIG